MRKLYKAALMAAVIGSLSMAGAGIATADTGRLCAQNAEAENSINNGLINIPNLNLPILSALTDSNSLQQTCVNGDGGTSATGSGIDTSDSPSGILTGLLG